MASPHPVARRIGLRESNFSGERSLHLYQNPRLSPSYRKDPKKSLKAVLQDSAETGLEPIYKLYSIILKAQIPHNDPEFQRMIGVLLTTADVPRIVR
jgi:hypothetical protein